MQTDGYAVYDNTCARDGIVYVGCFAHARATLYSLVETARLNGAQPYLYLKHLFEKLPYVVTREDLEKLLPLYFYR